MPKRFLKYELDQFLLLSGVEKSCSGTAGQTVETLDMNLRQSTDSACKTVKSQHDSLLLQ